MPPKAPAGFGRDKSGHNKQRGKSRGKRGKRGRRKAMLDPYRYAGNGWEEHPTRAGRA